jgi:putative transposase
MLKTFRYRLYPSKTQKKIMESTLETCRRFYNDCLADRKEAYETEQRNIGKYEQLKRVKEIKTSNPYARGIHSHILQVSVSDLDKAFQAFFRRVKAGENPGYPRFKGRNRFDSFGLKEFGNGFNIDGRRLKLSGIGRVSIRWHRKMEGKVKTVRIVRNAGRWFACFACEIESKTLPATGRSIGIDVGISSLLTTSDGEKIENPKWYRADQAKLRVVQRRVCRRKKGSNRRRKGVVLLQRQCEKTKNRRNDFLNKAAHKLIAENDVIVIEDLHITNMVRNRRLSKSIMDAGWRYLRQRLEAKAAEAGRQVIAVDPAYTSKSCSECGAVFDQLKLSDRWVRCDCGLSLDRDHNAALNILRRGHLLREPTWAAGRPSVSREAAGFKPARSVTASGLRR